MAVFDGEDVAVADGDAVALSVLQGAEEPSTTPLVYGLRTGVCGGDPTAVVAGERVREAHATNA